MDVTTAEERFETPWSEWTPEQQGDFVATLEPGDEFTPLVMTLCCARVERVPDWILERIPSLRTLKGEG